MVNSQEVLEQWKSIRSKLSNYLLTPQEKKDWEFMNKSKTQSFNSLTNQIPLDQLEKEITTERERDIAMETENDLLLDYWFCWNNFTGLILDWIVIKRSYDYYRSEDKISAEQNEKLEEVD